MEATKFLRVVCFLFISVFLAPYLEAQEPEVLDFETFAESNYTYLDPGIIYYFVSVKTECSEGFIIQDQSGNIEYAVVIWACGIKYKDLMNSEHSSFWSLLPYNSNHKYGCYVSTDPIAPDDLRSWEHTEDGKITLDFMMNGEYYYLKLKPININPSRFSDGRKF